ncbi:DNA repair and recombination protein RAD54B [Nematocida displodere]|uniref:DNA repair and recombination protein RAD54B n=1 Tax=Nematocida displodere TaxID=1805483 RepID=A0A177EJC1_9MICR|nr:DNA repair and recombination protein RAD54B [Nematocida displodere]
MQCWFGRKSSQVEGEEGVLRRTGGAFTLFSGKGVAVDRVYLKSGSVYIGALYVATTCATKELPPVSLPAEGPGETSAPRTVAGKRAQVPPPPEGSLVFTRRAYIEPGFLRHFKDYQVEGVQFMFDRLRASDGAMLADEMGLGKTFQAIAVIYLFCKAGGQVLVVSPCSLVGVWEREIKKWVGTLRVLNGVEKHPSKFRGSHDVLLLSYERLATFKECEKHNFPLVVCDEAHRLRTATSQALTALKKLESKRLLLTGTPFQNSIQEYKNLLGLIDARAEKAKGPKELAAIAEDAVLRRKIERTSLSLPQKQELVWLVENREAEAYIAHYATLDDQPGIHAIQKLRVFLNTSPSKWQVCFSLVREILSSGHSLVMVSRYIEVIKEALGMIQGMAKRKEVPLPAGDVVVFHGEMLVKHREQALAHFQKPGQKVIILSAKCGGEGLTLVKATQMIIIDSDWNPANDLQAMARVWRLGQTRPVTIHRLFLMGTIEEYILLVQMRKIELQREIEGETLTRKEVEEHLSQCETQCLLAPQDSSMVHDWSGCMCTEGAEPTPIQGYTHTFSEVGLVLKQTVNELSACPE